jgi:hypothetical protein
MVLSQARTLNDRGEDLEEKMMTCMKDSGRMYEQVRRQKK